MDNQSASSLIIIARFKELLRKNPFGEEKVIKRLAKEFKQSEDDILNVIKLYYDYDKKSREL